MEEREKEKNIRRTQFLDAEAGEPLAKVDALVEGLTLHDTGGQTSGKSVTAEMLISKEVFPLRMKIVGKRKGERTQHRWCR